MNAQVQPFTPRQIDAVLNLENRAGDTHWTRGGFERELTLSFSRFYVLTHGEQILGYGGFWKVEGEAQITNLAIDPSVRRQGWGKHLLFHLLQQARQEGCTRVTLEVRIGNEAALGLYHNLGFVATSRRPHAYSRPAEDALLMEKEL
jgi:[ribosomal protein S18]-alanine N-acetyltransferase